MRIERRAKWKKACLFVDDGAEAPPSLPPEGPVVLLPPLINLELIKSGIACVWRYFLVFLSS
jgi:hypothetical protein